MIVVPLERSPRGVDDKRGEDNKNHDRLKPPRVSAHGFAKGSPNWEGRDFRRHRSPFDNVESPVISIGIR